MDREQQRAAAREAAAMAARPARIPMQAWGGDIFVRQVTIASAIAARATAASRAGVADLPPEEATKARQRNIAADMADRICDEHGSLTFDAAVPGDVELLLGQGARFLMALNEAVEEIDNPKPPPGPTASS